MRYEHVCVEAVASLLPPDVVTSDEIEQALGHVYEPLGLPFGRLELMSGIQERRFFPRGTRPGAVSVDVARKALDQAGLPTDVIQALVHGSVCRDQLEPATASRVHHEVGLPQSAAVFDVSNACLGLLNGVVLLANMIELGQIPGGIVVGTETGRGLVEGTIDSLRKAGGLTRRDMKRAFASLTIGSGAAAIVLCDRRWSRTGTRLIGGAFQADSSQYDLCAGDVHSGQHGDDRPRMDTDSEALLHAGIDLAESTWQATKQTLHWGNATVDRVFTHQVGRAHRKLLFERLVLNPDLDFPTVRFLGNTGAVALPTALALGVEEGRVAAGDHIALLGIGSGLNALMLGLHWGDSG